MSTYEVTVRVGRWMCALTACLVAVALALAWTCLEREKILPPRRLCMAPEWIFVDYFRGSGMNIDWPDARSSSGRRRKEMVIEPSRLPCSKRNPEPLGCLPPPPSAVHSGTSGFSHQLYLLRGGHMRCLAFHNEVPA